MLTEPRTDPEMRQALRKKYAETPLHCPYCDEPMLRETVWSEGRLSRCANELHWLPRFRPPVDKDVLAAVDDADALAGALAEVERLRAAIKDAHRLLKDIEDSLDPTDRALYRLCKHLRAALAASGTPAGMAHNRTLGGQGDVLGSGTANDGDASETGRADAENAADGRARGLASGEGDG